MLGYKYNNDLARLITNVGENIDVNEKNVDWHLFQIGRDISLTKSVYEQWKNKRFNSMMLPSSLYVRKPDDNDPEEVDTYVAVLRSFIHYLEKTEKPFTVEQEKIRTLISNLDQRIKETVDESVKMKLEKQRLDYLATFSRGNYSLVQFVKNLVETRIGVCDNEITICSNDVNLINFITNDMKDSGKKVVVISKEESANGRTKL